MTKDPKKTKTAKEMMQRRRRKLRSIRQRRSQHMTLRARLHQKS